MPDGKTHKAIATLAGGAVGAVRIVARRKRYPSREPLPFHDLLQVCGSTLGGRITSRLPDLIEPATSSWHRGTAHSLTTTIVVGEGFSFLEKWEDAWREVAEESRRARLIHYQASQSASGSESLSFFVGALLFGLAEVSSCIISGMPSGGLAGYISHNLADFTTPRGIPVV